MKKITDWLNGTDVNVTERLLDKAAQALDSQEQFCQLGWPKAHFRWEGIHVEVCVVDGTLFITEF